MIGFIKAAKYLILFQLAIFIILSVVSAWAIFASPSIQFLQDLRTFSLTNLGILDNGDYLFSIGKLSLILGINILLYACMLKVFEKRNKLFYGMAILALLFKLNPLNLIVLIIFICSIKHLTAYSPSKQMDNGGVLNVS